MEIWLSARFFSTPFLCHNGIGSFVLCVKVDERQETWEQMEDAPTEVRAGQHTVSLDAVRSGGSGVWSYTSNNLSVLFVPGDRGAVTEAGGPRTIHPR